MKATLPFLNSYFWRSIYGPILAFIFPGILLIILGHIFRIEYIFPGIIALNIVVITNLLVPIALSEQKSSSIFKFIGTTKIGRGKFLFGVIFFYVSVTIISLLILFGLLMISFQEKVFPHTSNDSLWKTVIDTKHTASPLNNVQIINIDRSILSGIKTFYKFFQFLFSITLHFAFSLLIGLLIVSISKNPQWTITISVIITLLSMFLSGMIIPADIIASSKELKIISKFIPYSYTTGNIIVSTTSIQQAGIYLSGISDSNGNPIKGAAYTFTETKVLRDMIFGKEFQIMSQSSDNIFDFGHGFAVRKMPEIDKVMEFVKRFLSGNSNSVNPNINRFTNIWNNNIMKNDYGFMELFSVQSNKLYESWGKILNIFIPVVSSVGISFYLYKRFDWGIRR